MLVLEIFFIFVKNNPNFTGLNILKHGFLCTTYADTTYFLKDRNSIIELMYKLNTFSNFSGFKSNVTKFEIVGIDVLNRVQVAICGMKCIKLKRKTVNFYFSYNKNLEQDKTFSKHIVE